MTRQSNAENNVEPLEVIFIPELTETSINTTFADVEVVPCEEQMEFPELRLFGEEGDFEHSYDNGILNLRQLDNPAFGSGGIFGSNILIGDGGNYTTVISSGSVTRISKSGSRGIFDWFKSAFRSPSETVIQEFGDGSRYVNGVRQDNPEATIPGVRKVQPRARLFLPQDRTFEAHDIRTGSGNLTAESVGARKIKLGTISGRLALDGASGAEVILKTSSGDQNLDQIDTSSHILISSVSGRVRAQKISAAQRILMNSSSGDLRLEDINAGGTLGLKTVSGVITLARGSAGNFESTSSSSADQTHSKLRVVDAASVSAVSGRLTVTDLMSKTLGMTTSSGDIKLSSIESNGGVNLKTVSGRITANGLSGLEKATASSGDVDLHEVQTESPVYIQTVSGRVKVYGSSAPEWTIKTSSGDITTENTTGPVAAKTVSGRKRIG